MARVTVEDCILQIPDRFELVIAAAHRAKQISSGNPLTIERDNDKDAVVSLREIADQTIDLEQLREDIIQHFCRRYSTEAMEKALDKDTPDDVQEAFEDARQHISVASKVVNESYSGLSFVEDNIETED